VRAVAKTPAIAVTDVRLISAATKGPMTNAVATASSLPSTRSIRIRKASTTATITRAGTAGTLTRAIRSAIASR
jgi:hypothetical protein